MKGTTKLRRSVEGEHVRIFSAALFGPFLRPRTVVALVARVHQIQSEVINQLQYLQLRFDADSNLSHAGTAVRLYFFFITSQHKPNAYEKNEDRGYWRHWAHRSKAREEFTAARPRGCGGSSLPRR